MEHPHPVWVRLARAERDWAVQPAASSGPGWRSTATGRDDALATPAPQRSPSQRNRIRTLGVSAQELGGILHEQGDSGCVEHYREAMALDAGIGDNIAESTDAFNLGAPVAPRPYPALKVLDQAEHWYQRSLGNCILAIRPRSAEPDHWASSGASPSSGSTTPSRLGSQWRSSSVTSTTPPVATRRPCPCSPPTTVADLAVTHGQLGNVYRHAGDIARAFDHYQRSIKYEMARGNRWDRRPRG